MQNEMRQLKELVDQHCIIKALLDRTKKLEQQLKLANDREEKLVYDMTMMTMRVEALVKENSENDEDAYYEDGKAKGGKVEGGKVKGESEFI